MTVGRVLQVPAGAPPKATRANLVKLTACELRFPTLLEMERRPPIEVQEALRHALPHRYVFRHGLGAAGATNAYILDVDFFSASVKTALLTN